jgi:HK97 family phage portal protein
MGLVQDMIRDFIYGPDPSVARSFNPGAVAVDGSTRTLGVPTEQWAPSEYGAYIAQSNAVYTVVKKRATYLSSLPLTLSRVNATGDVDPITTGALYELTRKVNPHWTWRRLIEMTEMSLCLWGSAYWFLERKNGVPAEMYWARPDRVRVIPHTTNYVARFEYTPNDGAQPIRFAPEETIWFRYPNPLDEYSGLSPLVAARLAADTQSAAMKQNYALFKQGISIGGLVTPSNGAPMSRDAANEIKDQLQHRARGTANAHRWLVLMSDAKFTPMTMSPKDAEFVELHKLTLEDVCRPYGVPLDLVGGQRTYANYDAAVKAMWTETIIPEAAFLADEITEQLLPMFLKPGDRADVCGFDHSGVECLQDDEQAKWTIAQGQIEKGAITVNEWRKRHKMDPVDWGNVWWGSVALTPIKDAELPEPPEMEQPPPAEDPAKAPQQEDARAARAIRMAYGSDEHQRLWHRFVGRTEPHEQRVQRLAERLFRSQQQSLLTELAKLERAQRDAAEPEQILAQIFNLQRWRRRFREAFRPVARDIVVDAGQDAIDQVTLGVAFDVADPAVVRFLERQAQRFAAEVNDTTWNALKAALAEGLEAGEGTDLLAQRVKAVMGDRIRSSAETIARTEVAAAYSGGSLSGYEQSGEVSAVEWLSALDERTRETHVKAHGQVVALGQDFTVGGATGPGPGLIGKASESINCFAGDTLVYAEGVEAATMRWFEGDMMRLSLGDGRIITVTPNHPLLTPDGWTLAGSLNRGSNLLGYEMMQHLSVPIANPYPNHGPAEIAEIFRLCAVAGQFQRVAGSEPQFHGDGMDGQVDVVWPEGQLRSDVISHLQEPSAKNILAASEIVHGDLARNSSQRQCVGRALFSTDGGMGSVRESGSLFGRSLGHSRVHSGATIAPLNASFAQYAGDNGATEVCQIGESFFRHPGKVTRNDVIRVDVIPFRGHVYNLQTEAGHYIANGIISHNCRCTTLAVLKPLREAPLRPIKPDNPLRPMSHAYQLW